MPNNFENLPLSKKSILIKQGKIDILESSNYHFERIEKLNPSVRALRYFNKNQVLQVCKKRESELKSGALTGRLHGICFTAKDSVPVKDMPLSYGTQSSLVENMSFNSALIEKLLMEGAICIGKSNMAEQGKSYTTDNPLFGATNNPFKLQHTPGGSGGGDSAAVACKFADFGLGADAGGSIRVPAAFCGLFGLFPTRGIFSDAGLASIVHTFARLFRSSGIIAGFLDDLELLYSVLKGYDSEDPFSLPYMTELSDHSPEIKKVCVFHRLNGVECDLEIKSSLKKAAKKLEQAGYEIIDQVPVACEKSYEIFILLAGQAALILEDLLALEAGKIVPAADEGSIMQNLRSRIKKELPPLTCESLLKAMYLVDYLRNEINKSFTAFDAILCPVAATLPPKHGTSLYEVNGQKLQSQQVFQFASMVNVLGLPAISFPECLSKDALPVGLQLIGPRFSERKLFKVLRRTGYTHPLKCPI